MPAILRLALKSLASRSFSVGLTLLAVALSVTLFLGVEKVRAGARDSFNSTLSGTDLIVGARGASVNLLLYSVFRIGEPTANISWAAHERIAAVEGVAWTVPISLGDSHRGYRVVGTTPAYFDHYRYGRRQALSFSAGGAFSAPFEAVVGAEAADRLGLAPGDRIELSHGIGEVSFADHDAHGFTVTGVLAATGTPVDRGVHVPLAGLEAIHEGEPGPPEAITAFLVGLDDPTAVLRLQRQINTWPEEALTAVMPGVALNQLWQVVGAGEAALRAISVFVVAIGLVGILTSLSSSINERRREMAILRAVGARPGHVFALLVSEAAAIGLAGAALGLVLANGLLLVVAAPLARGYGLALAPSWPGGLDLATLGAVTLAAALLGCLPAWRAMRKALSDGLTVKL